MPKLLISTLPLVLISLLFAGCNSSDSASRQTTVRVEGSDTMVNVAQAWAETYHQSHPAISVQVLGGGSGVGVASLIDGNCDMANTSRKMKEKEIARAKAKRGADPIEHIVGYDALAIYVHKDNPLDAISIEELAEIYGEGGNITKWSQLSAKIPSGADEIIRVSRQNSSGTYIYFREVILGDKRDYKLGSIDQSGSKDVVSLVAHTPGAIGYSGMGYKTDDVKILKVSRKKGEPGVEPSVEDVHNDSYPITRPLQIYTLDEPKGAVKEYLDWILSKEGQKVVLDLGYVPVFKHDK
ncbi:MAG TPA: phosphate ABC transporter substrate-binding protein [Thermoguttaceae bacterium]